ncbi:MAG: polysaccharide biosynthesis protein [Acidimicrobiales bacterium]
MRVARVAARVREDLALATIDMVLTAGSYVMVLMLRFDGVVPVSYWRAFQMFVPLVLGVHLVSNLVWGLYRQMWRHASVAEAGRVLLAGLSAMLVLEVVTLSDSSRMPQSVVVFGAVLTTALIGVMRFQSRLFSLHRRARAQEGLRVVVIGAGESGAAIVRAIQRSPGCGLVPVAIVDDDRRKHGRSLAGVPVVERIDCLPAVIAQMNAHQALLAIPSADPELVRQTARSAEAAGVVLKVLPPVAELLGGRPSVGDVRDLQIEDLLGRHQVATDLEAVHGLLAGKRVLITGAGGSIGSEIARQVADCQPRELVLLDHDETHLHDAIALLDPPAQEVLADIRDADGILEIFRRHRPEVVFHAAAHKHVPILERFPCEAMRTNGLGTANVVAAAAAVGVRHLVFISTDKAVHPSSVMGATKWLGEQLVMARTPPDHPWCAVRFGNVVGSRGSVIPTFARQILAGGPLTVTDRRMTRFFMSVQESVQLVLQAAVFSRGGEVFMLDMGQPVNIYELAERMIRLSGRGVTGEISISITGTRPGEKLVEELRTGDEHPQATPHDAILRLYPARLANHLLDSFLSALVPLVRRGEGSVAAERLLELNAQATTSQGATSDDRIIDLTELEDAPSRLAY